MEQIRSADVLANFPQVDEEKLNAALAAEAAASNRKIIVLDDDPSFRELITPTVSSSSPVYTGR